MEEIINLFIKRFLDNSSVQELVRNREFTAVFNNGDKEILLVIRNGIITQSPGPPEKGSLLTVSGEKEQLQAVLRGESKLRNTPGITLEGPYRSQLALESILALSRPYKEY